LSQEQTVSVAQPLPANLVGRDWKSIFQPRLQHRVAAGGSGFSARGGSCRWRSDETLSMVELQLENFSPLPVTQIVWSVQFCRK